MQLPKRVQDVYGFWKEEHDESRDFYLPFAHVLFACGLRCAGRLEDSRGRRRDSVMTSLELLICIPKWIFTCSQTARTSLSQSSTVLVARV